MDNLAGASGTDKGLALLTKIQDAPQHILAGSDFAHGLPSRDLERISTSRSASSRRLKVIPTPGRVAKASAIRTS